MENLTPWKTIKIGFFLAIGFAVPMLVMESVLFGGAMMVSTSSFEEASEFESDSEGYSEERSRPSMSEMPDFGNYSNEVELGEYSDRMQGNQLLLTGHLINKAGVALERVELEAELFDEEGNFVYECSEYISKNIRSGETENFLIKCGCSKNGLPEFERFELSVVSASAV